MRIDRSLEEVWKWKEKIYQETKDISMEERARRIKENASRIDQKYGLNLKIINIRSR